MMLFRESEGFDKNDIKKITDIDNYFGEYVTLS